MHVTAYDGLDELPPGCGPLFEEAGKASFFLSLAWFRNLAGQALPQDCRVRIYVAHDGDDVRGILPMKFPAGRRLAGRKLEALSNYYSSLFMPLVASADCLQEITDEIARERWDSVDKTAWSRVSTVHKIVQYTEQYIQSNQGKGRPLDDNLLSLAREQSDQGLRLC